jgi:hypothetical protein
VVVQDTIQKWIASTVVVNELVEGMDTPTAFEQILKAQENVCNESSSSSNVVVDKNELFSVASDTVYQHKFQYNSNNNYNHNLNNNIYKNYNKTNKIEHFNSEFENTEDKSFTKTITTINKNKNNKKLQCFVVMIQLL